MPEQSNTEDTCTATCHICGRPRDAFRHVHFPYEDAATNPAHEGQFVAICIPCIAAMSAALALPIHAYLQGGSVFDHYGRTRAEKLGKRQQSQGDTPMPKWATDALREIQGQTDDA